VRTAVFRRVVRIPETSEPAEDPSTLLHIIHAQTGTSWKTLSHPKGLKTLTPGRWTLRWTVGGFRV